MHCRKRTERMGAKERFTKMCFPGRHSGRRIAIRFMNLLNVINGVGSDAYSAGEIVSGNPDIYVGISKEGLVAGYIVTDQQAMAR